jgi:hypothetical protein
MLKVDCIVADAFIVSVVSSQAFGLYERLQKTPDVRTVYGLPA